jgi:hypothetical protein
LLFKFAAGAPGAHVVVASIPRMGGGQPSQQILSYNAAIPGLVSAKAAEGRRISYVDVFAVIQVSDLHTDFVHLNPAGNRKLAEAWYAALRPLLTSARPSVLG